MTNKEMNAAIKNELKKLGYNTRDFSVSVKDCGYSTSIKIKIKNPEINRKEIEKILRHWEEIDREERTGEILQGCNNYLFIEYAYGIFDEVACKEWSATAKGAMMSKDETTKIFDGLYLINWEHKGNLEIRQQDDKEFCTFRIGNFEELCIFIYKFSKFGTIAA